MKEEYKEKKNSQDQELLTRKEAIKKMGKYAAYSAAVVTVLFASPAKADGGSEPF